MFSREIRWLWFLVGSARRFSAWRFESLRRGRLREHLTTHSHTFLTMSATATFFSVRAPVRVRVAQVCPRWSPARPSRAPRSALSTRGSSRSWLFARTPLTADSLPHDPRNRRPSSPSARPRAARPPRRPLSRRRTSSGRSRATPPRRRTAPLSWRWPRRSACTPSARLPRCARTARAGKTARRRRRRRRRLTVSAL